jgi:hypothetical protein
MFAGSYTFTGDVEELKAAHTKMLEILGAEGLYLHVAIAGDNSLTVIDACPSEDVFKQFSQGDFFRSLREKVGLPEPEVALLGDVHYALVNPA